MKISTIPMPGVPIIHADLPIQSFGDSPFWGDAQRTRNPHDAVSAPDNISIMRMFGVGNVCLYLTPADLIGICNTMLTDEERTFINVPAPSNVYRISVADDDILGIFGDAEYAKTSRFVYRRPLGTLSDPSAWRVFCGVEAWNEHVERDLMDGIDEENDALISQGGAA